MTSHTERSSRAMAAVIPSGWVCHSRVEPSTSASSNVTVPVGSSLTRRSLPFKAVSANGSVPLMLASMRWPHAAKHRRNRVDLPPRHAGLRPLAAPIYAYGPTIPRRRHRIVDSHRPEETTMTIHTSRSNGLGNQGVGDVLATAQITEVAALPLAPKNPQELGERAVVLGASMGGLLAARVLADFFRTVTVVERDVLQDDPANRRGVPQGRHAHLVLPRGAQILDELFPGILNGLVVDGAPFGTTGNWPSFTSRSAATRCCGPARQQLITKQWRCMCRAGRYWSAMSGGAYRPLAT